MFGIKNNIPISYKYSFLDIIFKVVNSGQSGIYLELTEYCQWECLISQV